ncbi:bifunctional phosphopantothenoylcysteine decarboxylase/phosphopantothenate--cysteine ligase CoaBC [Cryobacterium sp. CG_9.6]|uniref:bifunctional phosphopantothenoylcysteine decarboxylase/phosphopantothenate--cysteine ligase CoaBC n=1 Tax=Cryobacterium sp. CG_9.6 TaxID=2760710 RepID=UPI002476F8EC|nr:bifunctional phosphopantothenoylcysteine decarboxylase/phosphopantothenate--cysteine ligase CoaBC [Cryobacterium sp. CG_9.6]MDH6236884.1 phosphopantothenoylcysteine decarboxylase/phosphopantothenate--cysteine ligase [Cryobacterium sp. CG_9.6]
MNTARTIVVGITGGIAAYKAVNIVRAFVLNGDSVHVVATPAALRFIGKPTLEAISRHPVYSELYEGVDEVRHVAIGQSADLIVVAPATANTIAKLAAGLADDLLGNTILASTAPLVIAPAMHTEMWNNPATVANIATLRSRGITIVGPGYGRLTGQDVGAGRMEEPDTIVAAAEAALARSQSHDGVEPSGEPTQDLLNRRILISAGGTREPLDPVRFIGNRSSGKQGVALAEAARARGALVTLVACNLEVAPPAGVEVVSASSTAELRDALRAAADTADVIIMAAAVADYRPQNVQPGKIKKESTGETFTLELVKNPDILAELSATNRDGQVIVGFAAETEADRDRLLNLGRDKIARKGCDYLVLNTVGWSDGFATDSNTVLLLDRLGDIVGEASGSKMSVAHRILDVVV